MADPNPWNRPSGPPPEPPPPPPPRRTWVWIALAAVLVLAVLGLTATFPEALRDGNDWATVGYTALLFAVLASGLTRLRREQMPQHLRHAGIWLGVVAVCVLGAAYADELRTIPGRVQMAFSPGAAVALSPRELVIAQNDRGAFVVVGQVNGRRVLFIVDTGATETVLAPADARRVGIDVDALRYDSISETANGTGYSAAHVAERVEIGPIGFDDFPVAVNRTDMSASLLGLTFLSRLDSYEFRGRKLILRWRGPAGEPAPTDS